ncbi:MAG: hypothetical protein H0U57_14320 [Tatlockia sp.]|nr:hypothetical protein [Tatlockia sp.]
MKYKNPLLFDLIGKKDEVYSFIRNLQNYLYEILLFYPNPQSFMPPNFILRTEYKIHPFFFQGKESLEEVKTNPLLENDDDEADAIISVGLNESEINSIKSFIDYKKYDPFFIVYDKKEDTLFEPSEFLINATTNLAPYIFIQELINDVLPANKELLSTVSWKGEMLYLLNQSDENNKDHCFATLPNDVIGLITSKLIEKEFENDSFSFKFFKSEKNIKCQLKQVYDPIEEVNSI